MTHRLLDLPKLQTTEDDHTHEELAALGRADAYARHLVMSGPLLTTETLVRLVEAVTALSELDQPDDVARDEWAYRIGLMTGLRLGSAIAPSVDVNAIKAKAAGGAR